MEKKEIAEKFTEYCSPYSAGGNDRGQNKAANSLKNVSSASISQILNGNWELIKVEMWRNIGSQIGRLIFIR
ncbi:MAG: hypothetical protein LBL90_02535 [Prevotellaceae bacterium]|nr:hypothetical protein [Prevotellaceae bacterium]